MFAIGERIKRRRKELGMRAEDIAEILGISPATVYRYENGSISNMGIDKLAPIAKALNTTPAFLMGWQSEKDAQKEIADTSVDDLDARILNLLQQLSEDKLRSALDYLVYLANENK